MPFRHPDRSHDLSARIEYEVRERIEEAIDYVCLDALVRARRLRGLPAPDAASEDDRRAYTEHVLALLEQLRDEITPQLDAEARRTLLAGTAGIGDAQPRLIAVQVALARTLPDYWQRFEAVSAGYLSAAGASAPPRGSASGGEGRGLLARLFGRG